MSNSAIDLNAETPLEDENPNPNPTETLTDSSPTTTTTATPDPAINNNDNAEASATVAKVPGSADSTEAPANHVEKKIRRAERFGVPVQLTEEEKRNSRAHRFGTGSTIHSLPEVSKNAEEQKRKARAERFGLLGPSAAPDEEVKKKARLERFGSIPKTDPAEAEKRKARAVRFANPQSNSSTKINGNGDAVPKAAVAGNATGSA